MAAPPPVESCYESDAALLRKSLIAANSDYDPRADIPDDPARYTSCHLRSSAPHNAAREIIPTAR